MPIKTPENLEILGHSIPAGASKTIEFSLARLFTSTKIEVPIIIERSKKPGPTVLITAGIHGDEISGIEIARQIIEKKINKPLIGTVIVIPILNIFGFLNSERMFPDGRDLNRCFPGTKSGSLASRVAHLFTTEIVPLADFCLDFHTGGASRFNAPQIRISKSDSSLIEMAKVFNPPFIMYSPQLEKSYRSACAKKGIPILLYEGGMSLDNDKEITKVGLSGAKNVLHHLGMLKDEFIEERIERNAVIIKKSRWIRAQRSGLIHVKTECGIHVEKGTLLALITDPFGKMSYKVSAPSAGYIINVNYSPVVHQGDAIFNMSVVSTEE